MSSGEGDCCATSGQKAVSKCFDLAMMVLPGGVELGWRCEPPCLSGVSSFRNTDLLDTKFARIGARLKVADRPTRRSRTSGVISLDVQTGRQGELVSGALEGVQGQGQYPPPFEGVPEIRPVRKKESEFEKAVAVLQKTGHAITR